VISGHRLHGIQQLQDEPIYGDSSGPLFTIYLKYAEKFDSGMCERWQKDADGLIIFVRTKVALYIVVYSFTMD